MEQIRVIDTTLRDGSHAVSHSYSPDQVRAVASKLDESGVYGDFTRWMEALNTNTPIYVDDIEKIKDSKIDSSWFMPTLQQKEALASSQLEGTQATLDGVLVNQVAPNEKDKNLNEVSNYYLATVRGYEALKKRDFSDEIFFELHRALMQGNVRKPSLIGQYRIEQNYIGKYDKTHAITFIPPTPESKTPIGFLL